LDDYVAFSGSPMSAGQVIVAVSAGSALGIAFLIMHICIKVVRLRRRCAAEEYLFVYAIYHCIFGSK
jgi:hypothetical protein